MKNQGGGKAACLPTYLVLRPCGKPGGVEGIVPATQPGSSGHVENQVGEQAACLITYLVQATSSSRLEVQRLAPT